MTFVITQPCVDTMDKSCVEVCPVDCIHFEEGKDRMLYIDPVECIDCGACQPACPVTAIFPEGDVPAAMAPYTEINALWYQDRDAARAKVGGGAPAPASAPVPAAAPEPATAPAASPEPAPAAEAPSAPAAAAAPAAAETPAAQPAAAVAAAPAPAGAIQVEAGSPSTAAVRPSPVSVALLALAALSIYVMFVFPGPTWLTMGWASGAFALLRMDNGGRVGASVVLLAPLAVLFLLLFVVTQARDLGRFAASHERSLARWRQASTPWRRNEESRRYYLASTVQEIAKDRFSFPNAENPDLRTYVNLPQPSFGVEPRGSGEKVFPDIVTVSYPGFHPVAIAQVETRETVTREQAALVWARLENQQCPVYLYVPAGMLGRARDYCRSAGIRNVKFRTWRWSPNGMVVREA